MRGAGRTDAGVHALGQVVAFDSVRDIPLKGFRLGLNSELADDVRVHDAWSVAPGYNPRFDAMGKLYRYVLELGERKNPLLRERAWQLGKVAELDVVAMRRAARLLEGTHDYRAFRAADDDRENAVRTLHRIDVRERFQDDPTLIAVEVAGTAFMKNMVRILVGTLVSVGRGRLPAGDVVTLLGENAVRHTLQQTAPGHGLTLVEVYLGRQGSAPAEGYTPMP
jgi:tRNA pseudouridine38-40 synthase